MDKLFENILNSLLFKVLILIVGLLLCLFYGILLPAAIINLPDSWFGVLYSLFGIIAGILCFVYFFKELKILFLIIVPAVIFTIITLSGFFK